MSSHLPIKGGGSPCLGLLRCSAPSSPGRSSVWQGPLPVHTGHLSLLTGLAQQRRSPAQSALAARGPLHRTLTPVVILQLFCDYLSNVSPTSRTAGSRRARIVFPSPRSPQPASQPGPSVGTSTWWMDDSCSRGPLPRPPDTLYKSCCDHSPITLPLIY